MTENAARLVKGNPEKITTATVITERGNDRLQKHTPEAQRLERLKARKCCMLQRTLDAKIQEGNIQKNAKSYTTKPRSHIVSFLFFLFSFSLFSLVLSSSLFSVLFLFSLFSFLVSFLTHNT